MKTKDVLRRIAAWERGRPEPVGETLPWPRVEARERLVLAFVRMAGEARPWGFAAGSPGQDPVIHTVAEPRDAEEQARLALALGAVLLPHVPHPSHLDEADVPKLAEIAPRRQLWLPGSSHVEMLHLLDYRFSRASARENEHARDLARLGRISIPIG